MASDHDEHPNEPTSRTRPAPDLHAIGVERDGHVLVVTIDHPDSPLNAVDARLHGDLAELFRWLKQEDDARVVLLTGSGRTFSAGGDMSWFPELRDPARGHALRREAKQIVWDQLDVEIPIVCALNGAAVGLGASVALLCDLIVMSDTAVIADPHVQVGLVAGDGGSAIWPLVLGPLAAKRHLLLGEPLDAAEALRLGVSSETCGVDDIGQVGRAWADRLAAQPPLAVQGTKISVNQQIKQALLTSFDVSAALEMTCFASSDHVEAVDAFVEKRTPTFHAR